MNTNAQQTLDSIYKSITDPKEREYFEIHEVRYAYILEKILSLRLSENAKILDIGVYPPHLFKALEDSGYDMRGISSQHEKVTVKNVSILNIEREKFPFKNQEFDLVLMTEVIEHLAANPNIYLHEIQRVLKPGGNLIITTPNAAHLKNRMKLLFGKSASFPIEQLEQTNHGDDSIYYRHNREFTMEELQKVIKSSGFSITSSDYFSAYTPFRKRKSSWVSVIGYLVTQLFPTLKDSLFILAVK